MIQDGLAQKALFSKSCIDADDLLACDCWDIHAIVPVNEHEFKGTLRRLKEVSTTISKADFKLQEQAVGFNFSHCASP